LAQGRDEVLRHRLLNFYIVARQIIKGFANMVRTIRHGRLNFSPVEMMIKSVCRSTGTEQSIDLDVQLNWRKLFRIKPL